MAHDTDEILALLAGLEKRVVDSHPEPPASEVVPVQAVLARSGVEVSKVELAPLPPPPPEYQPPLEPLSSHPVVRMVLGFLPYDMQTFIYTFIDGLTGMRWWKIAIAVVTAISAGVWFGLVTLPPWAHDALARPFAAFSCPVPANMPLPVPPATPTAQ